MAKLYKLIAVFILFATIIFHLWLNFPETKILADPNDNIFQFSLVYRTNWIWENYNCPFSLSCIPNLVDHLVPYWAEGYSLPFYYSHLPQISVVASYNMLIKPVVSFLGNTYSLYQYYNLTKYLLLCFFPVPIYLALRLAGFGPLSSALTSFFASNFSTDGLYGIDPPSFLWRGWGLTSQLYAMYFLPLGLAFTYRAVKKATEKNETRSADLRTKPETNSKYINSKPSKTSLLLGFKKLFFKPNSEFRIPYSFFAFLFLTLTTAGHLGIGIIGLLSTIPFLFLDLNKTNLIARGKTLFVIYIGHMIALAYWIIPVFLYTDYHMVSFWDPIWKFDSYGWYEVGRQLVAGEIFDWKRAPIITFYVILGFFVLLADSSLFPFALSFLLMMLIYFGRNTWGGLVDFVPGMKDFHMHRFIVGVHIASIFLIPSALEALFKLIIKFKEKLINLISKLLGSDRTGNINTSFTVIIYLFTLSLLSVAVYYTVRQTVDYASYNNRWIGEANKAFQYDEKNFYALTDYLETLPPARIYAGRPGNWGHQFRLGSSQLYMLLSAYGFDVSQFLPETWSPMSENDQNFDERYLKDYELLNLKYIVSTENHGFPEEAVMDKKFGPFELYKVPTSGWFDVVTSPMLVKTDKTNFINLVHYWHRGFPRTWKMHPFITLKDIETPYRMQRIIEMKDEVTYEENRSEKNIFSDFPFVFPESTPSGKIINEKVTKQTYSSTVEVPENCKDCMIMFKMSYHPNWKASVDGKNAATYSVFPFYLAVKAESGTHEIVFTHKPNNLKIIVLTIQILIPCAAVIFYLRKKRA